ncbi:SLAIN motif-containing protein-like isoform X1 [Aplysia californica]|uniref:SLAIN motif-containing protein-like isoform X1 n=1 Tax=Aplysia californica TaxID=6500 RepID=A0ABM0JK36_APLCA|nr:SLAIN motif-containing protein-like isoform X1 [Aplysia californica]
MDGPDALIDPQNEVRKLQELVKKLERQNEVLRGKQGSVHDKQRQNGDVDDISSRNNFVNNVEADSDDVSKLKSRGSYALDDFDDVDHSELPKEEDSWLYSPSKVGTPQQSEERLMSWVRQDFDHPSPEMESSRRALLLKLDEVARMKHSSSSPVLGSQPAASRSATSLSRSTEESSTPSRGMALRKSGLVAPGSNRGAFDSGTFTRPKRVANGGPPMHGEGDHLHETPNVPNAADIENLAKLQEESLRQSITPASRKGIRAKHDLIEGDTARLSPSRFDVEGSYLSQHRGSLGSEHSTPPDSPQYNQQFQLSSSHDSRNRRNLSMVASLQHKSHNSSDSSLERHSVNSDEMNLAPESIRAPSSRLQQPNYRNGASPKRPITPNLSPSPQQGQQVRGLSPQRTSGLPTARRQIARPTTAPRSSLPTFRRANAPARKPPSSQEGEENWRDGCF